MIRSMTGYGEASGEYRGAGIGVTMKSVNNRYFDFNLKIPRAYMSVEESLKQLVQRRVSRGKVDIFITLDLTKAAPPDIRLNLPLARSYLEAVGLLASELGVPGKLTATDILRFPDIISAERDGSRDEGLLDAILGAANEALERFDEQRRSEGGRLLDDIDARLSELESLTVLAEERSALTVPEYRERLRARMEEVLQSAQLDEARILTEAAIFADRIAVNEETVRLKSHITELRLMLKGGGAVGRKLDFLVQELNREANTIASKGNDAVMARIAVDMKAEVEKIREQAQNIE